jgi:hypothetical protein
VVRRVQVGPALGAVVEGVSDEDVRAAWRARSRRPARRDVWVGAGPAQPIVGQRFAPSGAQSWCHVAWHSGQRSTSLERLSWQ